MERNIQKSGLVNLLVLLVVGVVEFAVARYSHVLAGEVATVFLLLAVLVAAVSWFQMRLEEQERLEKLEFDEVTRSGGSAGLFNTQAAEAFPARRSREQFEKFFVPGFSVLLFLIEIGGAIWYWNWLDKTVAVRIEKPLVGMAILGLLFLVLFILGKYAANLTRFESHRLLNPGASYLLLSAYLIALVVVTIIFFETGFPRVDAVIARALCILLGLLAVETAVTLVLEIYRPRVKGKVERLIYESRLVGLLSRPEGIFTTAAHALDYQFGFKVSETWFYKFLEQRLALLLVAQIALLFASTCFVFIEVGEQALWERFGQPVGTGLLRAGFHLKLPWPIDQIHRYRTDEIHTFTVGHKHIEGHEGGEHADVTLWTVSHTKEEFRLLVASREPPITTTNSATGKESPPVKLLAASIPVQYQITNLVEWAYGYSNPDQLLEDMGVRELLNYMVNADYNEVISRERFAASQELRRRIQARANALKLGVEIIFVGLQDIHPPVKVASAYEEVVSAKHKRTGNILAAQAHAVETNAQASAEVTRRLNDAQADQVRAELTAQARVVLYTNQIAAYRAAPEVYSQRSYLNTLVEGSRNARKYILATTNTADVIQFDLEEKIRQDLLGVGLPTIKSK